MTEFWSNVTAPQATIIAGLCTLLAAIVGVLLGYWLFSGRVKDLKGAIDATDRIIENHKNNVDLKLLGIFERLDALSLQVNTSAESLGQVRGTIGDIAVATEEKNDNAGHAEGWDQLRDNWNSIRDYIERIAADPDTDGRTRAKYARIDRRRYSDLIDALAGDGMLNADAASYRNAVTLWQQYRSNRREPPIQDVRRMSDLRKLLVKPRAGD